MAKIFEKKVIIGSVFGMLTTAIGIIAVFFPSAFNLEKSKFSEEIDITINSNHDLEILSQKVSNKNMNNDKIFRMRVQFCYLKDMDQKRLEQAYPEKKFEERWLEDLYSSTEDGEGRYIRIGTARVSYGSEEGAAKFTKWYFKNYAEKNGDEMTYKVINIKGKPPIHYYGEPGIGGCEESGSSYVLDEYFIPLENSGDIDYLNMTIEYVPKSQIKLMNY